mmetsp:Transcript_14117/g.27870  ORF Transcript_14117/g.27870 Transcript_14117/m.27870 type:complete len:1112 (+) Transcript_14117:20-3355(+)
MEGSLRLPATNRLVVKTPGTPVATMTRTGSPLIRPFRRVSIASDRTLMPAGRRNSSSMSMSIGPDGMPRPLPASEVEWITHNSKKPQDWLRHGDYLGQRSNLLPPPIGSATSGWGNYDTLDDIMSRPKPLGPLHQWKTMGHHGGQFTPFSPVNELYFISRRSAMSPGPGNYGPKGAPDPTLSTRGGGVGTVQGGKISTAVRETDADKAAKRAAKIPGPGAYDTDHLYGIHQRIVSATPQPGMTGGGDWEGSQNGKMGMSQTYKAPTHLTLTAELEDSIFDQRLVMSRQMPIDALMRHGTTRYSRMCKDITRGAVRKLRRKPRPEKRSVMKELAEDTARMEALEGLVGRREKSHEEEMEEEEEEIEEEFVADEGGGFSPASNPSSENEFCAMSDEEVARQQLKGLIKKSFGCDGLPPQLHRDGDSSTVCVTFALPKLRLGREALPGGGGKKYASLDTSKFTFPGVGFVRGKDDERETRWYCNCTSEAECVKRGMDVLHSSAGGCSGLESADCECVLYCKWALELEDLSEDSVIEASPICFNRCEEDEEEGGEQHGGKHRMTPVIDLLGGNPRLKLHQVGTCGGAGIPMGLLVDTKCVVCQNNTGRCVHRHVYERVSATSRDDEDYMLYTGEDYEDDEEDEDMRSNGNVRFYGKMTEEMFEKSYNKLVADDFEGLRLNSKSTRMIGEEGTESGRRARKERALNKWCAKQLSEDDVIELCDNVDSAGGTVASDRGRSLLLHTGSLFEVKVLNSWDQDGALVPYDGRDDGILNYNGRILFTHEFLHQFLSQAGEGKLSFSGFWRASVQQWRYNIEITGSDAESASETEFVTFALEQISRPMMENVFVDCIFDYISLLNVDYKTAFTCMCDTGRSTRITAVYDNCCKFLQSMLLRFPALAGKIRCIIDALHHSGHVHCSPLYNHKMSVALKAVNAAINEQKNRLLRYMQTSVAFLGQIRAAVYIRYHLARLSLQQKRLNSTLQRQFRLPAETFVFDGVTIGFKLALCCIMRPWETPNDWIDLTYRSGKLEKRHLYYGCEFERYTMMYEQQTRSTLWHLAQGERVSRVDYDRLESWLQNNRKDLVPYIKVAEVRPLYHSMFVPMRMLWNWLLKAPTT